jgi:hypothetical protein
MVPDAARFCPACGYSVADVAMTVGETREAAQLSPGGPAGFTRRTPPAGGTRSPSNGWLMTSDSINHGRFAPGTILDGRYRIIPIC